MNTKEFRSMFPTILSSTLNDSILDSIISLKSGASKNSYKTEVIDGNLRIEFPLPGLSKDDISVSFESGKLILEIKKSGNWSLEGKSTYLVSESFDPEGASAEMKNGVLEVKIPERSKTGSKKITVL